MKLGSILRSGHVAANAFDTSTEVLVGKNVVAFNGTKIIGDTVQLKQGASIWDVEYNELILGPGTSICGEQTTPAELPSVEMPDFPEFTSGSTYIEVPLSSSLTLTPGDYGDIVLKQDATLYVEPGTYNINSIDAGPKTRLLFLGPTEVRVADSLYISEYCETGPNSDDAEASDIVFYVEGTDGTNMAVNVGIHNAFNANVYAPNGTVWLRQGTVAEGAYIGNNVIVGYYVELELNSAF